MEQDQELDGQAAALAYAQRADNPLLSETLQTLPSYVTRGLVYLVFFFLVVVLVFAGVGQVDVYVTAPADLVPEGKAQLIQPDLDGILSDLRVQEGETVAAGDMLAVVESREVTTLLVALQAAEAELRDARQENGEILRLKTRQIDKQIEILGDKVAHLERLGQTLESKRRQESKSFELVGKTYALEKHKLEEAQKRLTLEAKSAARGYELWRRELSVNRKLRGEGVVSELQLVLTQKSYEEAAGAVEKADSLLRDTDSERQLADKKFQTAEVQHAKTVLDFLEQEEQITAAAAAARKEIDQRREERTLVRLEAARKLALAAARRDQARQSASLGLHDSDLGQGISAATNRAILTAPVAGRIGHVLVHHRGEGVRRGQTLLTLVPSGVALVAQLHVANKDVGQVRRGQRVKFKFDAFPYAEHGVIEGRVTNVVPEADAGEGPTAFLAYAELDQDYFRVQGKVVKLLSGMTATGEIVTERKTLLGLVLRPFLELGEPNQARP